MNYIEVDLQLDYDFCEILMAELAEIGFESFVETDEGIQAYIHEELFDEHPLNQLINKYQELTEITCSWQLLERKNWNEEWEKSYDAIEVNGRIRVRATFHEPNPSFDHEIVIQPKMSFGTGHHETTWLVMNEQLSLPHEHRDILDVGCGTGILAILASKLGARSVLGFDIDAWAVENTIENFNMNGLNKDASVFKGTINEVASELKFGGVLANINRNILLAEIPQYIQHLLPGGWLVVSGFYEVDQPDIESFAASLGLKKLRSNTRNQWATVVFEKK